MTDDKKHVSEDRANASLELFGASLTDKQAALVLLIFEHGKVSQVWEKAGYSSEVGAYAALKSKNVQKALRDLQQDTLMTEGISMAFKTYMDLLAPANLGSVRLGAARAIQEMAGMNKAQASGKQKALTDMTSDELADFIGRLDGALAQRADAAQPVAGRVIEHKQADDGQSAPVAPDS